MLSTEVDSNHIKSTNKHHLLTVRRPFKGVGANMFFFLQLRSRVHFALQKSANFDQHENV